MNKTTTMKKIPLLEKKDFGMLVGDCFEFIIQNFLRYSKGFAVLVLPPLLVIAGLMIPVMNGMIGLLKTVSDTGRFDLSIFASFSFEVMMLIVLFVLFMLLSVLQNTYSYQYMLLYEAKASPAEITVQELWEGVKSNFSFMLKSMLWFLGIFILFLFVSFGFIICVSVATKMKGLAIILMLGWFLFYMYGALAVMFFFFVRLRERTDPIAALRRCFSLIYGRWWRTFGCVFLLALLIGVAQAILLTPLQSMSGMSTYPYSRINHFKVEFPPLFAYVYAVSVVVSIYLSGLTSFAICLNYYNLVSLTEPEPIVIAEPTPPSSETSDSEPV